ncbi:L-threonylcarbamoyladenylate synthase [Chelatococcus reniformis]|uniref:Threonylcarbamoyl-AMP synthase n=1 Tax=Chelatococcus reniformis TaxID=1494448 RepID=A0A916U7S6_9HYPH|nr:L-threonylcarbamoyladenylate synthase [Chelatococcus reniformis]GGC62349.1 threonylcarbamoyl-AMP synthase [Chelatococcus reniformis]
MECAERLPATAEGIARAAGLIRGGGLVAFPTETVYGLGADAGDARAVAALYAAKGRPSFNPLIAHVPSIEAAERLGRFGPAARALAERFWPGPLTLVVPRRTPDGVCDLATAGLDTVALRVPAHRLALALLEGVGRPVVAPSANRSGHVSPTTASHVLDDLGGRIAAVLDGDATPIGVESSIVLVEGDAAALLRPGGLARAELEIVLGRRLGEVNDREAERPQSPGLLASHYAPSARVRLSATEIRAGEAALLFGGFAPAGLERAVATVNLSPAGDTQEAAAALFGALRRLDALGVAGIAVAPIPDDGLGEAINDRLRRAAAPRP